MAQQDDESKNSREEMHVSTKGQLLLTISKRKNLSQMVKKDRQDLRVWFTQAAYVLTSLRIELVRSRQVYCQSVLHEGRLSSQPLTGPRITPASPSAFSCGKRSVGG